MSDPVLGLQKVVFWDTVLDVYWTLFLEYTQDFSSCPSFAKTFVETSHRNFLGDSVQPWLDPCYSGSEAQIVVSEHVCLAAEIFLLIYTEAP